MENVSKDKLIDYVRCLSVDEQLEIMLSIFESGNPYVVTKAENDIRKENKNKIFDDSLESNPEIMRLNKTVDSFQEWSKKNPKSDRFMPTNLQLYHLSNIDSMQGIYQAALYSFYQGAKYGSKYGNKL